MQDSSVSRKKLLTSTGVKLHHLHLSSATEAQALQMTISLDPGNAVSVYPRGRNNTAAQATSSEIAQLTARTPLVHIASATDNAERRSGVVTGTRSAQPPIPHPYPRHGRGETRLKSDRPAQLGPQLSSGTRGNAVSDLLPYCSTGPPLGKEHVIALTDVVGSLKELVLVSISAASGDTRCVESLKSAVGGQNAENIVDFFTTEWEIDS